MMRLPRRGLWASGFAVLAVMSAIACALWTPRFPAGQVATELTSRVEKSTQTNNHKEPRSSQTSSERGVYPFNRVVVVAIGIDRYEALSGTPDLRFAEADARAFADITRDIYGYETVRILGKEATKLGIEQALKKFSRELGDQDA